MVPHFFLKHIYLIFQWRAAVQKEKDNDRKEEGESEEEAEEDEHHREELLGPSTEYVPQEEIVLESSLEVAAFFTN